jgi:hypothetical protein
LFSIGLTVLLGVSLFLTGCPTDADDSNLPEGNWYDGLASPTLTGIVLVTKDLTVPAGETLAVSGVTLTVNGTLKVSGTGTFAGTDGTSRLVVHANATVNGVSGVSPGKTYLWAAGTAWGNKDTVTAAVVALGEIDVEAEVDANDPTKVNLTEDAAFDSGTPEIPALVTLAVPNGITLSVDDSVELTVTGALEVAESGTLEVAGTLAVAGTLTVAGTLDVAENGGLTVEGTLSVADNGTLDVAGTLDIPDTGEVEVAEGGTLEVEGVLNNSGTINVESGGTQTYSGATGTNTGTINIRGTSNADAATNLEGNGVNVVHVGGKASFDGGTTYQVGPEEETTTGYVLISGTFTFNNADVLNGDAKVKGTPDGNDSGETVKEPLTLTIGEDSTLTLPDRSNDGYTVMKSSVDSAESTPRILGAAGASIVLEARGQLYFREEGKGTLSTFVGTESWNNFYSNPTTKITAGLWDGVETYVWATNLGVGENESGWVKQ